MRTYGLGLSDLWFPESDPDCYEETDYKFRKPKDIDEDPLISLDFRSWILQGTNESTPSNLTCINQLLTSTTH